MIQVHHWGGTTGKQSGSGERKEEGDEGEGQLDDQNRKARPRDWAVLARLPAWSPPSSASSVQGLEIRGILLAGIIVRLPHPSAASQRFWETRLQYLVLDNLYTQTHYKSGHLRLGHQTWFSLPPYARTRQAQARGRTCLAFSCCMRVCTDVL